MTRRPLPLLLLATTIVLFAGGARRRAVRPAPCPLPTVTLSTSPGAVCNGEPFTLTWQASQPNARVIISGLTGQQPAAGSRYIANGVRTFTARATNGCSTGPAVTFDVAAPGSVSGTLGAPSQLTTGTTGVLQITASTGASWSLTSQLGNTIDPSFGTGSRSVTYYATRSGFDVVTLNVESSCSGSIDRSATIEVKATTPPPTTSKLRCCDGTFSPSCTSCANQQGCCSGHGGVCSCGK